MKLPRDVGTNTTRSPGTNRTIIKERRTQIRNHGTTRIKNHGKRIISIETTKESKPKDTCITVTKDVKYFCPTSYDNEVFRAVTKLLSEKIEQEKWSEDPNAKTVNTIECENFCNFFKIAEQLYDADFTQVVGESTPKILGNDTD